MQNKQELEIKYINIDKLKPYENNPRNNEDAIDYVKNSIKEYGFKVPLVITKDNVIVTGHTRFEASKRLGLKDVPCIIADDLTEEQIKSFRLVDNKVSEYSTWDFSKLNIELQNLDIDLSEFGLEIDEISNDIDLENDYDTSYYGDERERTNNAYNLGLIDYDSLTNDFWQIPIIKNDNYIPKELIGFNYAKSSKNKDCSIHFYIDDYQFERIWNYPEKYTEVLREYDSILSPDFSLYMDMPMAMKIWNIYRSRFIGAYYQRQGIKVIPTISWAEKETFKFCFQGIPKGSVVSVSTIGVKEDKNAMKIWFDGMDEMLKQIEPSAILIYGGKLDYDYGDIETYYFDNQVTERLKDIRK